MMYFSSKVLIHLLIYNPYESLKLHTLKLLSSLSSSENVILNWFLENIDIIKICETFLYHSNAEFNLIALEILINFCRYSENEIKNYQEEILTSFCLLLKSELNSNLMVTI